jgi:hypothetical protein
MTSAGPLDPNGFPILPNMAQAGGGALASGAGNYFVAWSDSRVDSQGDLYAAHVSTAGMVLDPAPLILSAVANVSENEPALTFDGTNFFVAWYGALGAEGARVSTTGVSLDNPPIVLMSTTSPVTAPMQVASNGNQSVLVAYSRYDPDPVYTTYRVFVRFVSATPMTISPGCDGGACAICDPGSDAGQCAPVDAGQCAPGDAGECTPVDPCAGVSCDAGICHAGQCFSQAVPGQGLSFVTQPALTADCRGGPYHYAPAVTGATGAVTYALRAAPVGMSVDAPTGALTWQPAAAQVGSAAVELDAFDSVSFAAQRFDVAVMCAPSNDIVRCDCSSSEALLAAAGAALALLRTRTRRRARAPEPAAASARL